MREKLIEQYLCEQVREKLNGHAYKFTSPGRRSVPDRLCVIYGCVFFVECKASGKILSDSQRREGIRLKELGQQVYCINSKDMVDKLMQKWKHYVSIAEKLKKAVTE